ncbi:MAG: TonB family protein [Candidatus Omnitrophota bacterium]
MFKEKTFQIAFWVSILVHAVALYQLPQVNLTIHKSPKELEVTYQQLKNVRSDIKLLTKKLEETKDEKRDKIRVVKTPESQSSLFKDNFLVKKIQALQSKPKLAKVDMQKKKSITSTLESKMENPLYKNYYQKIREKIKKRAYKNYTKYEEGEVYLSFMITNDGNLKAVKIFKDKSSPNEFLQEITLMSVQDAAPYPKFPADLDFPELSFNVIISFELGD